MVIIHDWILSYLINWGPGLLGSQITSIKCVVETPIPIGFWACSKWSIPPLFRQLHEKRMKRKKGHPWIVQYQLGYPIFKQNDMILNVGFRASAHLYNDNLMIMENNKYLKLPTRFQRCYPFFVVAMIAVPSIIRNWNRLSLDHVSIPYVARQNWNHQPEFGSCSPWKRSKLRGFSSKFL